MKKKYLMMLFVIAILGIGAFVAFSNEVKFGEATHTPITNTTFLYIENIFPADIQSNLTYPTVLPTINPPVISDLFDWNATGPVGFQMMFEVANLNPAKINSISVQVNGQQINNFAVSRVLSQPQGSTLFRFIPSLFADTLNNDQRFKIEYVVPYKIRNDALKVHMQHKVIVKYNNGTQTIEKNKYVTLLNDPMLLELLSAK